MQQHPIIQMNYTEALAMAELFIRCLSSRRYAEIMSMDEHPSFRNDEGKVLLTYGEEIAVNTGASLEEFLDWLNAHRVIVKAIQLSVARR